MVESVDAATGTLELRVHGIVLPGCSVRRAVITRAGVRRGARLRATVRVRLVIYLPPVGQNSAQAGRLPVARVLEVDPSYRVLTLQYPDGDRAAFKMGLHAPLAGVEPGDSVAIHCIVLRRVRSLHHRVSHKESAHSRSSAA